VFGSASVVAAFAPSAASVLLLAHQQQQQQQKQQKQQHRSFSFVATRATSSSSSDNDNHELPLDFPRRADVLVALTAVRKACAVTLALQPSSSSSSQSSSQSSSSLATVSKVDLSPVTVGDFAAQAIVLRHLKDAFEEGQGNNDSFIAEESSQALEEDEELAKQVLSATKMDNMDIVKQSIDLGKEYELWQDDNDNDSASDDNNNGRPERVWSLDPIDGTKGFLRGKREGGQYCVALALLENGVPTIGILGCPNLPASATDFNYAWGEEETAENNQQSRGCIFVATKDGGCYQLPYIPSTTDGTAGTPAATPAKQIHVTPNDTDDPSEGRFCIGVEKFSDALGQGIRTAQVLHGAGALNAEGEIIKAKRIDSQAKYGVLARAGAEYYARFTKPQYVEWIWDHAPGFVVLTEAGGQMSDLDGNDIDFSLGAKLSDQVAGVLGSNGGACHAALVDAFQTQEAERLLTMTPE